MAYRPLASRGLVTTKLVKLPILWSQISPCRPRKQILLNFFLGLSGRCHHAPAKASSSTPQIFIHPPERKYENPSLGGGGLKSWQKIVGGVLSPGERRPDFLNMLAPPPPLPSQDPCYALLAS